MRVTLSPESEDRIRQFIDAGAYPDADSVIRDALRLLDEQEHRRQGFRAELQPAVEQAERGELIACLPEQFTELKQRAIESAWQGKPIRDVVKP